MIYTRNFVLLVFFYVFFSGVSYAQYYTPGTDPASIKWNTIETEHFKIVFAQEYGPKAQEVAHLLEEMYQYGGNTLKHSPAKIKVLVHSETAYSNGYVTWAPKRVELFMAPNQRMHAHEWLQQLTLHEFRHVVQIDKIDNGFTKVLSYVFGEQAVGAVLGLYVPLWFLEGDAVATETALSHSGRGRLPWFEMGMRAQIMDKGLYPYEKAYFGSYKDYVPNYYEMGYQLVAGARAKYGADIWEHALYNTGRNPFVIPFNQGQKQMSGKNKVPLYVDVFNDLKKKWQHQDSLTTKVNYHPITKLDARFVSFRYPQYLANGNIVAEVSGPGEVKRLVKVDEKSGAYQTIIITGSRNTEPFSVSGNTICWSELIPDTRWENRHFSDIKLYDVDTQKLTRLTYKQNYTSPSLSPKNSAIACVKSTNQNEYSLVIVDVKDGAELHSFAYGDNSYIYTPSWNKDATKIVCVVLTSQGKKMVELDVVSGKWTDLMSPTYVEIALPHYHGDSIVFTGSYGGTEEQYMLRPDKNIVQLTQSKYGANSGVVVNNNLLYSNYTADGYQLVSLPVDSALSKDLTLVKNYSVNLADTIAKQEPGMPDFDSAVKQGKDYEVKSYSKWNIFNLHSWAPVNIDAEEQSASMGVSAMSQNLLGSAVTTLGFNADPQSRREKYYFNFTYRGWYPILSFNIKHGDEKIKYDGQSLYVSDTDTFTLQANTKQYFTTVDVGAYVPFNFTRGRYSNLLQPSVTYKLIYQSSYNINQVNYSQRFFDCYKVGEETIRVDEINYNSLEYGVYFHHLLRRSQRDVATRWGQIIELKYAHTPVGNYNAGAIAGVRTKLFFPGLAKYHSITLSNNYQYKFMGDANSSDGSYVQYNKYGDFYNFPRGYQRYNNDRLYSFKGDYIFPLWNPDFVIPGLMYFKRITTNLFYDYSWAEEDYKWTDTQQKGTFGAAFQSVGVELRSEIHVLRFLYPLTIGYRYARLLTTNDNSSSLFLGLSFSGFAVGKD